MADRINIVKTVRAMEAGGESPDTIKKFLEDHRRRESGQSQPKPKENWMSKLGQATMNEPIVKQLAKRAGDVKAAVSGEPIYGKDKVGVPARAIKTVSSVLGGTEDVMGTALGGYEQLANVLTGGKAKEGIVGGAKAIGGGLKSLGEKKWPEWTHAGGEGETYGETLTDLLSKLVASKDEVKKDMGSGSFEALGDMARLADWGTGAALAKKPIKKAVGNQLETIAKRKSDDVVKQLAKQTQKIDSAIETGISKGIRPTVVGKPTISRFKGFYNKANEAVKTIADNRDNINLVDDVGEKIPYPRSAKEMADAIDQTKKIIYDQYHKMAIASGDAGAEFNAKKIVSKLQQISDPSNKKLAPQTRKYAESLIADISELDGAAPDIIEERIKDLNSSLSGYYEGRVAKATAQIDGSVANLMRQELDDNIMSTIGEGYQGLKNKYGALKAIEKEVNKRAIVNARKAPKGFFDITDVFTKSEMIGGLLTANPAMIAKGASGDIIKNVIKSLNDPDKQIKSMFKTVYDSYPAKPKGPSTLGTIARSGVGGAGGAAVGANVGETPEERKENALAGLLVGLMGANAPQLMKYSKNLGQAGQFGVDEVASDVAKKTGVNYNGTQKWVDDSYLYDLFTDPQTKSTLAATSGTELLEKLANMRNAFSAGSK